MFSANSAIEEIKEKVSIEEVVSQVVPLKKAGRTLKGLCPFHSEKTPSFIVFPDKGNFHCFGCGANGDIFGFVMRSQNVGFGEALKLLAEKAGVTLPTRRAEAVEGQHRSHLFEINDAAARYFHNLLLNADAAKIAREYLHKRAIDADTIEAFQLGYSLNSWQSLTDYLVNKGYDLAEIVEAGLAIEREGGGQYDRFRGRLIFPIRDSRGNVTGFGGRALDDSQPKYLNSPQTPVFDKSASLYGIDLAGAAIRREDKVVVVEGYFDAVVSHQCGMKNVVASLGTALTEKQVGALKRLTKKLVLALDPDAAGDEATLRGLEVAKQVFDKKVVPVPSWSGLIRYEYKLDADIRIITLPRGQDPDEVIRENPEEWRWSIEHALPIVDYYFSSVSSSLDLTQAKDKSKAAERLLPIIKELPDKVEQAHYVQKLAQMVQVSEKTIELSLSRAQTPRPTGPRAKNEPQSEERVSTSIEEYCLILMLVYPEVRDLVERIDENWMSDTLIREMLSSMRSCFSTEEPFDLDRFREGLEPILQECFDRLQRIATSEPPVSGKSVAREFEDTARDLERSHLHEQLSRLRFYYSCLTETQG
ncbi:MAG: DNA primase, partial [Chloroflexi bacterium]|nr:DNA primase [Chloroflexota bacterium]